MGIRLIGGVPFGSLNLVEKSGVVPNDSAPAFDPLELLPYLWYTNSGVNSGAWEDASGNGNNATQTSPASRPSIAVGQNGLQVRNFDGVDDFFTFSLSSISQPAEIWMVYSSSSGNIFSKGITAGECEVVGFDFVTGSGFDCLYAGSALATFPPSESFQVLRAVFNGASSIVERNGVNQSLSGNPGAGGMSGVGYLGTNSGVTGYSEMSVGEILILPPLSAENAAALTSHFLTKWAITP